MAVLGAASLLPRKAAAARNALGANERIVVGVIGAGGQGTHDTRMACTAGNVVCGAMCDLAEFRLDWCNAVLVDQMRKNGQDVSSIDRFDDYRALLDRKDVDAVVIATPDHWHKEPFLAAVEAGKHIYQEKPFSFSIADGHEMLAAAKKKPELCIQIGTQRRSEPHYAEVKQFIDDGKAGDITFVRAYDCRNYTHGYDPFSPATVTQRYHDAIGQTIDWKSAKIDWDTFQKPCEHKIPFDPVRYTAWRWFWDYAGGLVTDVGVHVIDNVHWLLGEPTPKSAVCHGGVYALDYWETPDVVNAVIDYGKFSLAFTGSFTNGYEESGFTLFGTKATIEVKGNDVKVWAEGDRSKPILAPKRNKQHHQHNWIEAMRAGRQPSAPVDLGVSSLLPSHLSNLAYRQGKRIHWDPATRTTS